MEATLSDRGDDHSQGDVTDGSDRAPAPEDPQPSELPPVTADIADGGDVGEVAGGGEITDLGGDSPSS